MKMIIYGSQYGTAKQYAEELSKKTGINVKEYKMLKILMNMKQLFI